MDRFFADTYALIEMIKKQGSYRRLVHANFLTTRFNLAELYYALLRDFNTETAEKYVDIFADCTVEPSLAAIKIGMELKLAHKSEKLSYIDCVGWATALEWEVPFLTGDEKFANKANVAFVP